MRNVATLALLIMSAVLARFSSAQSFESEVDAGLGSSYLAMDFEPVDVSSSSMTYIRVRHQSCLLVEPNVIRIDAVKQTLDVSLNISEVGFLCPVPATYVIPIGILPRTDSFSVSVFMEEPGDGFVPFGEEHLLWDFHVDVSSASYLSYAETPAEGSIQSGVGLIRGWACDAKSVEVQFDDLPRTPIPYGSARTDTNAICGDDDNGYGAVFAWGSLGHGTHTMKTFIDGRRIREVTFEVRGLEEPFVTGLSGGYELPDFPATGQTVRIEWSEADQNFTIVDRY